MAADSRFSSGWKLTAGGRVERGVGVVDAMEPPEHGHAVHQDVLRIHREIERDHRSGHAEGPLCAGDRTNMNNEWS